MSGLFNSPEDIEAGRQLVLTGVVPSGMADSYRVIAYRKQQRERRDMFGCCGKHETCEHRGQVVCKHTMQACPRVELWDLLELFGMINNRSKGSTG